MDWDQDSLMSEGENSTQQVMQRQSLTTSHKQTNTEAITE